MPAQEKCVSGSWKIFFLMLVIPALNNFIICILQQEEQNLKPMKCLNCKEISAAAVWRIMKQML
jgi:hypothetical protein